MQILPDIFLANGFPYGQHQNSYIVRLDHELIMVDAGDLERETFDLVRANCSTWGIQLEQIRYLLITHSHFDHSSHASRLQRIGVKIVTNRDGADALASGDDRCIGYAVHRRFEPCKADLTVKDGEELDVSGKKIRCFEVPGHANSCVLYEIELNGQRLWFVGDVILTGPECQTVQLGWNGGPDYDRSLYLETLRRLSHMSCDCLLPGHGPPCIGNGKRLVEMAYTKAMTEWR